MKRADASVTLRTYFLPVNKKANTGISLRALGDATIKTPVTTIDPSSEIIFAAALYLLLERREPVSRRTLQAVLWPDASDRNAAHRLRQTLLKLRRVGFPIELAGKGHIGLATESVRVDYEDFLATRNGIERSSIDALVLLPAYEPRFSQRYLEWLDTWKADVNASMTRVMLGIIARHRVKGEWIEAERNASKLLRFQPYNEEATLAMAEAWAMRGGKLQAMEILDKYLNEVGSGPTDLRLPATIMRRRIADRMHPRMEAAVGQSPLVGRGEVMEQLGELLHRSRGGKGHSCLVWGDAGVGKTRLLAEFATFASLQGIHTQRVQCRPNDRHRPLSAFVDLVPALRTMRGAIGCSPETFGYLDRLTKHKSAVESDRPGETDSDIVYSGVEQALFDLFDAVSDECCLIVLVEDVHWLDSTSAKLLREMVAWSADHSILLALTGRDRPEEWPRMPEGLTDIHLRPLDTAASRDVFLGVVRQHGRESDDEFIDWCVRVAEGNPYFLQELANHWVETGDQHEIPPSLAAVLNERISRLGPEALLLLQTCALLETHATLDRIEKLMRLDAHRMLPAINELALAGMVVAEADDVGRHSTDRLLSRHDLLSNAALARLAPPARAFLHRRAGAVFEAEIDHDGSASTLWDCAKHWQLAGNVARAFQLAQSCATHLMDVGLPGAAAEAYGRCLDYCTTPAETEQVLVGQAQAYFRASDWLRVREVASKARKLSSGIHPNRNPHDDLELIAMRALWRNRRGEHPLEQALRCLNSSSAPLAHRVQAGSLALMLLDETCNHSAMHSVFALVEKLAESPAIPTAARLEPAVVFHTICGNLSVAVTAARSLLSEQRCSGNVGDVLRALYNASVPLRATGLLEEAEATLLERCAVAMEHKLRFAVAESSLTLANLHLELGHNADAHRCFDTLRRNAFTRDQRRSMGEFNGVAARLALLSDRPSEARTFVPRSITALKRIPLVFSRVYSASLCVAVELSFGNVPSNALLEVLEEGHILSRRTVCQAYPAYALYVGLKAAGRGEHGSELLNDYLVNHRRETYPPAPALVATLERYLPLAREKRNRRRSLPTILSGNSRS